MSEITKEEVQELINTTVSGLAARQEREFQKLIAPISEQIKTFGTFIEGVSNKGTQEPQKAETTQAQDPKIAVLERQLNELKAANEAAQQKAAKAERDAALSRALNGYTFANDASRDTAFKVFTNEIQTTSDGQYVIGDQPLDAAVKARMNDLTGLLAPKAVGGSGANSTNTTAGAPGVPLEIKPGMKPEEYNTIFQNIQKQFIG